MVEMVDLGHLRTICQNMKCKDVICHDKCSGYAELPVLGGYVDYLLNGKPTDGITKKHI